MLRSAVRHQHRVGLGLTAWIHLSWTAQADLENVSVTLSDPSKGRASSTPKVADGSSGLMVDLSTHEIDFTAIGVDRR